MITEARKTRGIIRRGTRANQPLATDVLWGTLYYVTDEGVIERSNGVAWELYSKIPPYAQSDVTSLVSDLATINASLANKLESPIAQADVTNLVSDLASKLTDNAWINIPFNAANFTGTGTLVWTVEATEQQDFSYKIIGDTVILNIRIEGTDISGVGNELRIALPIAITPLKDLAAIILVAAGGGLNQPGFYSIQAGVPTVRILQTNGVDWPVGIGNTSIYTTFAYEI